MLSNVRAQPGGGFGALSLDAFPRAFRPALWTVESIAFWCLAAVIVLYAASLDRSFLIDQANYVDDFSNAPFSGWFTAAASASSLPQAIVLELFSEEILWRVWTKLLAAVFAPATCVLVTVVVTNVLVAVAIAKLARRIVGLLLWALLPVAFVVTGLLQIRQGFAFAVFLAIALRWRRPVLAALLAAMTHTTFFVVLAFVLVGGFFRRWSLLQVALVIVTAAAAAYAGGTLFNMFGGRRLLIYSTDEGATSLNFVLGGLLCVLPSMASLLTGIPGRGARRVARPELDIALAHVGAASFTIFSVFLFPLGASRVAYFTQLMLIPLLAWVPLRRPSVAISTALTLAYLVYLFGKTYVDGGYSILSIS